MGCLEGNVGYQGDVCCHKGTVGRQEGAVRCEEGNEWCQEGAVGVRENVRCHEGTVGVRRELWGVRRGLWGIRGMCVVTRGLWGLQ